MPKRKRVDNNASLPNSKFHRIEVRSDLETAEAELKKWITEKRGVDFDAARNLIKELEKNGEDYAINDELLNDCLLCAVQINDVDAVDFFIDVMGADSEIAIKSAILLDDYELLDHLSAEAEEDFVKDALENDCGKAIGYFLVNDFSLTSKTILSMAASQSKNEWVESLCALTDEESAYELIKYVFEIKAHAFIPIFLKILDPKKLLIEIQAQDGDNGLFNSMLDYAKDCLSGSDYNEILSLGNLEITDSMLIYPAEDFNGYKALDKLRNKLDKDVELSDTAKSAANFIGMHMSTYNGYFAKHPGHDFGIKQGGKYFRSLKYPFTTAVTPCRMLSAPHDLLPEKKSTVSYAQHANSGSVKNPLDAMNDYFGIISAGENPVAQTSKGNAALYDHFLEYRQGICVQVVNQLGYNKSDAVKVGVYHYYPCVMVFVKTPDIGVKSTLSARKAWTQLWASYFMGIVNFTAQIEGLDTELISRPSFGFLTPTIAPCGQSFRINVGIVPKEYADVLATCLKILNNTMLKINSAFKEEKHSDLDLSLPVNNFLLNENYQKYIADSKDKNNVLNTENVKKINNILKLAWACVDTKSNTAAYNLMRTSFARNGFAAEVYRRLQNGSSLTKVDYSQIFIDSLRWGFSRISVIKIKPSKLKLKFDQSGTVHFDKLIKTHVRIKDAQFFKCIGHILKVVGENQEKNPSDLVKDELSDVMESISECLAQTTIHGLYNHLEMLNELLYVRSIVGSSEYDDHDSDSDEEDNERSLFAKKVVVPCGMRAIWSALHASAEYVDPGYLDLNSTTRHPLSLHGMYYETPKTVRATKKFKVTEAVSKIKKAKIVMHDINFCETTDSQLPELKMNELSNVQALICDSTSATISKHREWVSKFKQSKMQILFFVSSGLKNEQMGADKNPYGTVRVIAKNKDTREKIIQSIKSKQPMIKSSVSHGYRRMMKKLGCVPTNRQIIGTVETVESKSTLSITPVVGLSSLSLATSSNSVFSGSSQAQCQVAVPMEIDENGSLTKTCIPESRYVQNGS